MTVVSEAALFRTDYTTTYTDENSQVWTVEVTITTDVDGNWYKTTHTLENSHYTTTFIDGESNVVIAEVIVATDENGSRYTSTFTVEETETTELFEPTYYTTTYIDEDANSVNAEIVVSTDGNGSRFTSTYPMEETETRYSSNSEVVETNVYSTWFIDEYSRSVNALIVVTSDSNGTWYTRTYPMEYSVEYITVEKGDSMSSDLVGSSEAIGMTSYTTTYINENSKSKVAFVIVSTDAKGNCFTYTSDFVVANKTTANTDDNNLSNEGVDNSNRRHKWNSRTKNLVPEACENSSTYIDEHGNTQTVVVCVTSTGDDFMSPIVNDVEITHSSATYVKNGTMKTGEVSTLSLETGDGWIDYPNDSGFTIIKLPVLFLGVFAFMVFGL